MSDESQGREKACQTMESINWKQCILCQSDDKKKGVLVKNPRLESYGLLLQVILERASLNDGFYVQAQIRLQNCTLETMCEEKPVWHRSCYSSATNKVEIQRAKDRNAHALATGNYTAKKPGLKLGSTENAAPEPSTSCFALPFTRSHTSPLDKKECLFCQQDNDQKLYQVRTENAGKNLKDAVERSHDPALKTRLNTCLSPGDAHAGDILYHKACWTKHVFNALRDTKTSKTVEEPFLQRSSLLDLINIIDVETQNKAYIGMDHIETTYVNMLGSEAFENHVPPFNRKWLKQRILAHLPHLKSVRPNIRKPTVLYSPDACEEDMVNTSMTTGNEEENSMKTIYKAAEVVRKSIATFTESKERNVMQVSSDNDDVPAELYTLIHWIMVGPAEKLETVKRTKVVDRATLTVSQNIMYGFKSSRQVKYKPSCESASFKSPRVRENPQVLGLALTVHHDTRNKKLMNLLKAHGYTVPHGRALLIETALANAVVENARAYQGLYVPPFLKKRTFVFFAVDNTDFAEDTPDGKGTTHGTIIAVYQKVDPSKEPVAAPLIIGDTNSLSVTPYHVDMVHCDKPQPVHIKRSEQFAISQGISESYQLTQLGWVIVSALSRIKHEGTSSKIPGWGGYNSLLSESLPFTQVGTLPLLPEVAHEWSTLLTVIKQVNQLRKLAVGEDHPTVITFDMALYEKVVQLIDARPNLKQMVVPRLGELHVIMAALRALGASMENSGIDDAWVEAGVYGPATTRQILKCTHYKRALHAHIYSYVALYEMALEEFFKNHSQLKNICLMATEEIEAACCEDKETKAESVKQANSTLLEALTTAKVMTTFQKWKEQKSQNAMFKAMVRYLDWVEAILFFVAATRNADLELHLQAGEVLSKMFFAMDRIKYKRLWPRYIVDMRELRTNHPQTWEELRSGNISVTKSVIPFVSVAADHACEHFNKLMKTSAGIRGISNNANARQRFFLVTPELSRLSKEFKSQFDMEADRITEHHELGPSSIKRAHSTIDKIKKAILSHGNPFTTKGDRLYNVITNAYIPDEYMPQILNVDITGQKLFEDYVSDRINGPISLWSPVKKENNKMFLSGNKKITVKLRDKTVDLKETKDLFARLMVLARSSRDINQKEAIGNHEFTLTPRALFAPDGTILSCYDKSKLIHLLKKLTREDITREHQSQQAGSSTHQDAMNPTSTDQPSRKIALVDGMVLVQKLSKKPATVVTVKDLSRCFNDRLMQITRDYDEIILIFDTYRADSLKSATRNKRRQGKASIQYQVKDDTNIRHIPMSKFLSHDKTKADLTDYLADKTLDYNRRSSKLIITSASGYTRSNKDLVFEVNNHEEADTLMIYQAMLASQRNPPDAQLVFFSPDTDVLVLVTANYDLLLKNTSISMASDVIQIKPLWEALGKEKAKALPAFHAFTGADNTGKFSRICKSTWLQIYLKADEDVVNALQMLMDKAEVTEGMLSILESFVCAAYSPKGINIKRIPELRWYLFCKHRAESDRLPPTPGALKQHILRVHVQARIWAQATIALQIPQLNLQQNGYFKQMDGMWKPTTTEVLPAPKAIIEMVQCKCKSDCSSGRCSCRAKYLACTDMCHCNSQCQNDEDSQIVTHESDDDDYNYDDYDEDDDDDV